MLSVKSIGRIIRAFGDAQPRFSTYRIMNTAYLVQRSFSTIFALRSTIVALTSFVNRAPHRIVSTIIQFDPRPGNVNVIVVRNQSLHRHGTNEPTVAFATPSIFSRKPTDVIPLPHNFEEGVKMFFRWFEDPKACLKSCYSSRHSHAVIVTSDHCFHTTTGTTIICGSHSSRPWIRRILTVDLRYCCCCVGSPQHHID